jgi:hypothetical protein
VRFPGAGLSGPQGRVNDADVRSLEYVPTLKRLSLGFTAVGDDGMPYLRRLSNLELLNARFSRAGGPLLNEGDTLSPRLESALSQRTELEFADQPLSDVIDWLAKRHKVDIELDDEAFAEVPDLKDAPVTSSVRGITLRSA